MILYGQTWPSAKCWAVLLRRSSARRRDSSPSVAQMLVQSTEPSLLRNIPADEIQSKDVYDAAVKGDKLALDIFEFTGRVLGEALANSIAFSSPEAIILFGGLAKSGDYLMKPIQKAINENVLKIYAGKTKLLLSQLKDADAAVLGASALGWETKAE